MKFVGSENNHMSIITIKIHSYMVWKVKEHMLIYVLSQHMIKGMCMH